MARMSRPSRRRQRLENEDNKMTAVVLVTVVIILFFVGSIFTIKKFVFDGGNPTVEVVVQTDHPADPVPPPANVTVPVVPSVDTSPAVPVFAPPATAVDPSWGPRKKVEFRWLELARILAQETGHDRALRLIDMAKGRTVLAMPRPGDEVVELMETPQYDDWIIAVVPMQEGDNQVSEKWLETYGDDSVGSVQNSSSKRKLYLVVLKEYLNLSDLEKAQTVLHEFGHIDDALKKVDDCVTEQNSQQLEIDLMRIKAKEKFEQLERAVASKMIPGLKRGGIGALVNHNTFSVDPDTYIQAEGLFGSFISQHDKAIKLTKVWIMGAMKAIEEVYPTSVQARKKEFYCAWRAKTHGK